MAQDLRSFLELIEKKYPDQLLRVKTAVNSAFDATAVVLEAEKLAACPVVPTPDSYRWAGMLMSREAVTM